MTAEQEDRLIDIKKVQDILGIGKTKIYEMAKPDGPLGPPRKIGRCSRWSERHVRHVAGLAADEAVEELL